MAAPAPLSLDAARLGAMSPSAQLAARDFARLAGEGLSTLYWEEFFRGGFFCESRFPGLENWRGVAGLQADIRRLLAAPADAPVLLASRTTALMEAAVKLLALRSRRILTTDTLWPPYRTLLAAACRSHGVKVVTVPVRDALFRNEYSRQTLIERVVREFVNRRCDGVFLSSVSHDGVRIPLAPVVQSVRSYKPGAFVVVDGAQEFAHVPINLARAPCDVYVAGCHKWLGASLPLGVAVFANSRTAAFLESEFCLRMDDPLFAYVRSLDGWSVRSTPETVNLLPLVCAQGALTDFLRHPLPHAVRFRIQRMNVGRVARMSVGCGWSPVLPPVGLRSGILLLRTADATIRSATADELQRHFSAAGVTLTAYAGGVVRLSLPNRPLRPSETATLATALATAHCRERSEALAVGV